MTWITMSRRVRATVCLTALSGAVLTSAVQEAYAQAAALKATTGAARGAAAEPAQQRSISSKSTRSKSARRAPKRTRPVGRPTLHFTTPHGPTALANDMATFLGARVRSGTWGVVVVSLARGDTLYAYNADVALVPASTMKLYTTALAFERLGPGHQFTTDVFRDGAVGADGTLNGNLYLRGGGDPALSMRFVPGNDPGAPMATLARMVAATGIRRVRGDLIGDATSFEAKMIPDGWLSRYSEAGYAARVSSLSLNENLAVVRITAGKGSAKVQLEPASGTTKLVSTVKQVAGSRGARVRVARRADGALVASGWIGSRATPRAYQVVVHDPALFTAGAFRSALESQGIAVGGATRLASTPNASAKVASLPSPALATMASVMNRESINHFAELIFRNAARSADAAGIGSAASGNAALRHFMTNLVGARPDAVYAADGSGLSTLDRITPRSLVQLLSYAHRSPWSADFHASLPVAGESELLRHRMRLTPAQGNLHAKTGTTNEVIALGGYVTAKNGEPLAFSFIYNGKDRWSARETIDVMGATLASFER